MADKIRIRAQMSGDTAEIKALMRHPMETGQRKDDAGNTIPAHFITSVTATIGERTVMQAQWGAAVSQNPFLAFRVTGVQPGDEVSIRYVDNKGESGEGKAKIK
jgi:sulfur-oxidizing protein SoxZ